MGWAVKSEMWREHVRSSVNRPSIWIAFRNIVSDCTFSFFGQQLLYLQNNSRKYLDSCKLTCKLPSSLYIYIVLTKQLPAVILTVGNCQGWGWKLQDRTYWLMTDAGEVGMKWLKEAAEQALKCKNGWKKKQNKYFFITKIAAVYDMSFSTWFVIQFTAALKSTYFWEQLKREILIILHIQCKQKTTSTFSHLETEKTEDGSISPYNVYSPMY